MRSHYPNDATRLPATKLCKLGLFEAYYNTSDGTVSGWLKYETTKREKRKYVFYVSWKGGVARASVSVANPDLGLDFDSRETREGRPVYRELKGLPSNSRQDLHQYACRIAQAARSIYIDDYEFLSQRIIENGFEIGRAVVGTVEEILFKDEDWLIISQHTSRGIFLRAEKTSDPLQFSLSVENLKKRAEIRRSSIDKYISLEDGEELE